jgi:hypothetical protein
MAQKPRRNKKFTGSKVQRDRNAHGWAGAEPAKPAVTPQVPKPEPKYTAADRGHLESKAPQINARAEALSAKIKAVSEPPKKGIPRGVKIGGGVLLGTAAAGGAYAAYRHHKKKETAMSKSLINPFEEVIVFGKAYPVALPVPSSTKLRALVPTGAHIGHANDLQVFHGGGPRIPKQALQRYTAKPVGLRQGPFTKAADIKKPRLNSNNPSGPSKGRRIA